MEFIHTFYDEGDGGTAPPAAPPAEPSGGILPPDPGGDGNSTEGVAPPQDGGSTPPTSTTEGYNPFSIYEDGKVSEGFTKWAGEDKTLVKLAEKYANAEDPNKAFAQGVKNLQYLAGQKALDVLPEDAPEEVKTERNQLLAKLNKVPEKPEGYGIQPPEELKEVWNPETITEFSSIFHKHNASPELVQELMSKQAELEMGGLQQAHQQIEQTRQAEIESLQKEHGENFSKVIQAAKDGARTLGLSDEEANLIATSAVAVNALAQIPTLVSEDRIVKSDGTPSAGGSFREQSRAIAQDPNNPLYAAYWDSNHPNNEHARAEKERLSVLAEKREGKSGLA